MSLLASTLLLYAIIVCTTVDGLEVRTHSPLFTRQDHSHDENTTSSSTSYWTSARMQAARFRLPHHNSTSPLTQGNPRNAASSIAFESFYISPETVQATPIKAIGRLFYSLNGRDYSCSASVAGPRVLWTAAHCVYDDAWSTNVVFVPAYHDGSAPFGAFAAYTMIVLDSWIEKTDFAVDFANIILGEKVDQIVGVIQTRFNYNARLVSWSALGFPAESPFDGNMIYQCDSEGGNGVVRIGRAGRGEGKRETYLLTVRRDNRLKPSTLKMGCDAGGGASGGPWLINYNEGSTNLVMGSVSSYKYSNDKNSIYGPLFGDEARMLFENALGIEPNVV